MAAEPQLAKGERTRRAILEAAKNLFLSQGYTATSMRQIAQAVGVTPAALYNHFSGKEEIFTSLLQQAAPFERAFELFEETAEYGLVVYTPHITIIKSCKGVEVTFSRNGRILIKNVFTKSEAEAIAEEVLQIALADYIK